MPPSKLADIAVAPLYSIISSYPVFSPCGRLTATRLEVTHALHCLDHLRKAFYPNYYPPDSPIHGIMHRDHCLDHLRQMVLCNNDLTPIPTRYYKALNKNYIDSDRPHTCRNWPSIRDWVWERYNGSLAVPPAKKGPLIV